MENLSRSLGPKANKLKLETGQAWLIKCLLYIQNKFVERFYFLIIKKV